MSYDPENIFAKILRNEIPANRVYEDDATLAFMDIMPRSPGHLLVIPKTPCRNVLDASDAQLSAVMQTVRRMGHAVMKGLGADGVSIQQFNEAPGGQEVFHLHFHVLPRFEGDKVGPPGVMGDMEEIAAQADKIRSALR